MHHDHLHHEHGEGHGPSSLPTRVEGGAGAHHNVDVVLKAQRPQNGA